MERLTIHNGMYKRLDPEQAEAIYKKLRAYEDTGLEPEEVKEITSWSYGPFHKKMGDWLKAEHEGRLVVLPLKVGTTVYRTNTEGWSWLPDISECVITCLTITQNKKGQWTKKYRANRIKNGKTIDSCVSVAFEDIGKTIFLSREDAEKALKGVSEDA